MDIFKKFFLVFGVFVLFCVGRNSICMDNLLPARNLVRDNNQQNLNFAQLGLPNFNNAGDDRFGNAINFFVKLASIGIKVGLIVGANALLNQNEYYNKNINPKVRKVCKYVGTSKLFWAGLTFMLAAPFVGLNENLIAGL